MCVVNAAAEEDLHVFALGLRSFEMHDPSKPRSVLCRTAASFVSSCLLPGEGPRPPVGPTQGPPDASRGTRGGILVCGSYVPKTTAQIASLLARTAKDRLPLEVVQVEASLLADGDASPGRVGEITRAAAACDRALQEGRSALVYTSRALVRGRDEGDAITVQARVASGLVEVVRSVATRPAFLISKGGITSADMARRAMGAQSALVLGQAAPGVPLWSLQGPCVRFPGLPLVVFPGNVGGDDTLADVAQRWLQPCVRPGFKELLRNARWDCSHSRGAFCLEGTQRCPEGVPGRDEEEAQPVHARCPDVACRNQGYAIGAFNVYDLNGAAAVVSTAEEARAPVILQAREALERGSLIASSGEAPVTALIRRHAGAPRLSEIEDGRGRARLGAQSARGAGRGPSSGSPGPRGRGGVAEGARAGHGQRDGRRVRSRGRRQRGNDGIRRRGC